MTDLQLGSLAVGGENPPVLIAEACINHQGSAALAMDMVRAAADAGSQVVKFQYHVLEDEMLRTAPKSSNFSDSLFDTLASTNLTTNDHLRLRQLCDDLGIEYLCTPFSAASVDILEEFIDPRFYKVGSGELLNFRLLERIMQTGKPVIMSTGMSSRQDVRRVSRYLESHSAPFALLHCVSAYPAGPDLWHLDSIPELASEFRVPIGFSDHSPGWVAPVAAVAKGANIIEKHVTFDRSWSGPDHASSANFETLAMISQGINEVWRGRGSRDAILPEELEIAAWAHQALVARIDIPAGTIVTEEHIAPKRPAARQGQLPGSEYLEVLGSVTAVDVRANEPISPEMLKGYAGQ